MIIYLIHHTNHQNIDHLKNFGMKYINIKLSGEYILFEISIVIPYRIFYLSIQHNSYDYIYYSPRCDSSEQFYDELIIFKELLLQKLLNENK